MTAGKKNMKRAGTEMSITPFFRPRSVQIISSLFVKLSLVNKHDVSVSV